ncbi:MAG TPA: nucleotide kinase [Candidatus Cloacimonetes bacterium]|nr:nucleotide kinase [Candidatus Cloacimonadota bacterium]
MTKKLLIINGTLGVGKTAVCEKLYKKLENSIWLDGDWCWMMNPFKVTEENKRMVEDNITHLLKNFLKNPTFEYVIFSWIIHQEYIYKILLNKLQSTNFELKKITLMCSENELLKRMKRGKRSDEEIRKSIEYLKSYPEHDSIKIETSDISVDETVEMVLDVL